MPTRSDEERQQINEIRLKLDELEAALRACVWIPNIDRHELLDAMSWTREHINKGRTQPPISLLYQNLFAPDPPQYAIDLLILQLKKQFADTGVMAEQVPKLLLSKTGWTYRDWIDESDKFVPQNWSNLPEPHPDKTDQFGFPFYLPTDDEGFPVPGFDKERLSNKRIAERARQKYGNVGIPRDSMGQKYPRIPLPRITQAAERSHRNEAEHLKNQVDTDLFLLELKKWYREEYMPEQLRLLKESLAGRQQSLKDAIKAGTIDADDIKGTKFDIDEKVSFKRKQLETTLESSGNLMAMQGIYRAWKDQKEREQKNT